MGDERQLKPSSSEIVQLNLLPTEKASVSEDGITFKGMIYACSEALSRGWFDRFKQNWPSSVEIAFDPRRTDRVYLRPDDSYDNYWICELSDKSRRYKGMSFVSAAGLRKQAKKSEASARQHKDFHEPDMQSEIEAIVARERAKKPKKTQRTKSERLSEIGDNKVAEREWERQRRTVDLKPKTNTASTAKVVPLRSTTSTASLDYPSLDDFIEDDDD